MQNITYTLGIMYLKTLTHKYFFTKVISIYILHDNDRENFFW